MERRAALIRYWTLGGVVFGFLFPLAGWILAGDGLSVAAIQEAHEELQELEAENQKLKEMYVDLSLEHKVLKDIVEKKLSR